MKHGLYFQSSRTEVFSETVSFDATESVLETPAPAVPFFFNSEPPYACRQGGSVPIFDTAD